MKRFADSTVLVTGASQGIGEAVGRFFAGHGARVVLVARRIGRLEVIADAVRAAGGKAICVRADVADYEDVAAAFQAAIDGYGGVDILVNNAGVIDPIVHLGESDPGQWSRVVDINLKGVYYGMRCAIPIMLRAGGGIIVNISSGAATKALEGWSHYCATKAAVLQLTRCAHKEYGEQGIRVVGISPGTVATGMQTTIRDSGINPVSRLDASAHIPPEWVARAIGFLCGPEGGEFAGGDFSLKNDEGRRRAGLPPVGGS